MGSAAGISRMQERTKNPEGEESEDKLGGIGETTKQKPAPGLERRLGEQRGGGEV